MLLKYLTADSKASYTINIVVANSSIMELQRRSLLLEVAPGKNEVGHLDRLSLSYSPGYKRRG